MVSSKQDREYHEARAEAELRLAEAASDPAIAAVHRELAALHRRRMIEIVHLGEAQIEPMPLVGGRPLHHDTI
jgi:hypothetical protein